MSTLNDLMGRIKAMPNSSCFLADFASTLSAMGAIKSLSFASVDNRGIALPSTILCETFGTTAGAQVVIGGSLTASQSNEVYAVFQRLGSVKAVALPKPGAAATQDARKKQIISKGIVSVNEAITVARQDMLGTETSRLIETGNQALKAEGPEGARALAALLKEMLECKCKDIL